MAQAKPFRGSSHGRAATAVPTPLQGANILIVDANPPTAKLLRSQLEDRGAAAVEIAINEDEALDVLGNVPRPILLAMMETAGRAGRHRWRAPPRGRVSLARCGRRGCGARRDPG